jgi:hypothetical protein
MAPDHAGNVVGVDPQKRTLTATVTTPRGGILASAHFRVSGEGHRELEAWARQFGQIARWGIEGASGSAWDGRPLALLTRTAPARATSAHISIIGHITQTELRRHTTTVEIANGFLNRNADPAGMPTLV